jgi:hypothetical protein
MYRLIHPLLYFVDLLRRGTEEQLISIKRALSYAYPSLFSVRQA